MQLLPIMVGLPHVLCFFFTVNRAQPKACSMRTKLQVPRHSLGWHILTFLLCSVLGQDFPLIISLLHILSALCSSSCLYWGPTWSPRWCQASRNLLALVCASFPEEKPGIACYVVTSGQPSCTITLISFRSVLTRESTLLILALLVSCPSMPFGCCALELASDLTGATLSLPIPLPLLSG